MSIIEQVIKRLSDDELNNQISIGQLKLERLQDEIDLCKQYMQDCQQELESRLKATSPIKAGDKVLLTYDIISKYNDEADHRSYVDKIEGLIVEDGKVRPYIYHCDFSMEDALTMRQAYLQQQGEPT